MSTQVANGHTKSSQLSYKAKSTMKFYGRRATPSAFTIWTLSLTEKLDKIKLNILQPRGNHA